MAKLLGLLKVIPNQLYVAVICFLVGYFTCINHQEVKQKELYIEQLQEKVQAQDFKINSLIQKLADDNTRHIALNERFKRLQSTNAELTKRLKEDSSRIANDQCRSLLSECVQLNGRSTEVQREGVELVRTCERNFEVIKVSR